MSANPTQAFQDIKTKLTAISNIDIIDTHDDVTLTNGVVKPYVVLTFGGPIRVQADRGIVESKRDTTLYWVIIECVSNDLGVARKLKVDVISQLEDYVPNNSGRVVVDGGFSDTITKTSAIPKRFVEATRMSFHHNLNWA